MKKTFLLISISILMAFALAACGASSSAYEFSSGESEPDNASSALSIVETNVPLAASPAEQEPSVSKDTSYRIVATSPAVVDICARLDLDLVGVPNSTLSAIPSRYDNVTRVGTAMGPDLEIIKTLQPDYVIGPAALQIDLQPKMEAAGVTGVFLNLESIEGLYKSISQLGELLDRRVEADQMINEFAAFYQLYTAELAGRESPRVLVLMGLPGSYVVATDRSYVGSLVRLAGGTNVYAEEETNFITANTEDMLSRDPDIILRAAHAMPEDVMQMFADEFVTNDIWRHFRAVREGKVFDLPYEQFGMSAKFNYPTALGTLKPLLYGE